MHDYAILDYQQMKKLIVLTVILPLFAVFVACNNSGEKDRSPDNDTLAVYQTITGADAKALVELGEAILVDVRALHEYNAGHIVGALHLIHTEVDTKAAEVLPDKNATIIVYCVAGVRSKITAETLISLGYKSVFDMGSMRAWPS